MIHHVVIWSFRREVDETDRTRLLADMRTMLQRLPMVRSFALGENVTPARARGFTHMLISVYDDLDALSAYVEHPEHKPLRERQRALSQDVIALDIET
jgi:hypothetical protein